MLPLVLLHGALGAAAQLEPLRALLGDARPVLALDFEGHGPRASTRPFGVEQFADDVRAQLRAAGIERAAFFGYSMGGYVALHLAAAAPELVAAVCTLGTKLAWSPEVAEREARQLDAAAMRAKVPRFADALAARHTGAGWERVVASTAALLHDIGRAPSVTAASLATVACPARLMVGDRDATVTLEETRDAMRLLPRGELEVLPATPHPFERVRLPRLAASIGELLATAAEPAG